MQHALENQATCGVDSWRVVRSAAPPPAGSSGAGVKRRPENEERSIRIEDRRAIKAASVRRWLRCSSNRSGSRSSPDLRSARPPPWQRMIRDGSTSGTAGLGFEDSISADFSGKKIFIR